MTRRFCNKCGNGIELYNNFHLGYKFGYESAHDGEVMDLDLCGTCLAQIVGTIRSECKYDPIEDIGYY